jgi:hypothetical protein
MAYLTESKLASVIDIPVSLSGTEIKQGDWLMVSSCKIALPTSLTVRFMSLQVLSSSVDITRIGSVNRVSGNLGLAYLVLRRDYVSGNPGTSGALETLIATDIGIFQRDTATSLVLTVPGTYSWFLVNNMKADATSAVPPSVSIDFRLCLTGQARLDFSNA